MVRQMHAYMVPTSHGAIAVSDSGTGAGSVLLIHGNSSSSAVFQHQIDSAALAGHRLVAIDLPGHGASADATHPARTYTRPGFAEALVEVIDHMGLADPVLLGWSLGGHIALELAPRLSSVRGIMICGAPPVGTSMAEGFQPGSAVRYGARNELSAADLEAFGQVIFGATLDAPLRAAMARADGRARRILFEAARAGAGIDQRRMVEHFREPLAVVNGAGDAMINLDYIDRIAYANLWSGKCHRVPAAGHAPFRDNPAAFNALLASFLADIEPSGQRDAARRAGMHRENQAPDS